MKPLSSFFSWLWPQKIKYQLILLVVLSGAVIMAVFVTISVKREQKFLIQQNKEHARAILLQMSINSSPYILANDLDALDRIIQNNMLFSGMRYAMIISDDKVVLANSDKKNIGLTPSDSISQLLNDQYGFQTLLETDEVLDIAHPVYDSGKNIVGWVRIGINQNNIRVAINNIVQKGFLYALFSIFLTALLAFLWGNRLTNDFYKLVLGARRIIKGDHNFRFSLLKGYEFSKLSSAFNQMLDEVSSQEKLLSMVLENLPLGVWILNEKGEIISANIAGKKIWGDAKYVGIDQYSLYKGWFTSNNKPVEINERSAARAIKNGETILNNEIEIETFDGQRKYILDSALPLKNDDGIIIGAVVLNEDITEKVLSSKRIREAEVKFSTLFEEADDAIAVSDLKGNFIEVNSSLCRLTGYTKNELLQMSVYDVTGATSIQEKPFKFDEIAKGSSVLSLRRVKHKSGKLVEVEVKSQLLSNDKFFSVTRDLTNIRRAEREIALSEATLRAAFETSTIGIAHLNIEGVFIKANSKFCEILNTDEKGVIGNEMKYFFPATLNDDKSYAYEDFLLRKVDSCRFESSYVRADGKLVWMDVNMSVVTDQKNQIQFYVIQALDITKSKANAAILIEQEEQLRLFVEYSPASIAMFDKEMRYLLTSKSWMKEYKIEHKELIGHSHYEVFPEIPDRWKQIHKRCLSGAIEKNDDDIFIREDGTIDWVRWEIRPWRNANGDIGGIIMFTEVITEKKKAQDEIKKREAILATIFDNVDGAACLLDTEKKYVIFNRKFVEKHQRIIKKNPVEGELFYQHFSPEIKKERFAILDRALKGENIVIDVNYDVDEKKVYYRSSFNPVITDGKVTGIIIFSVEMTEVKEKEVLLEQVNYYIKERNKELQCLFRISEIANDSQKSMNQILSECVDIIPSAYQYPDNAVAKIIFKDQEFVSADFKQTKWKQNSVIKNSNEIIGEIDVCYSKEMPHYDEGPFLKEERLLINSIADILGNATQKKIAEALIKEQSETFEAIIENTKESIYLISTDFKVLQFNKTAKERIKNGRGVDLYIGIDFREFMYPETQEIFKSMFNDALHGKSRKEEIKVITITGKYIWFQSRTSPAYDKNNILIGVTLLVEGIDERKKAEEEILRLNRLYRFISDINDSMLKMDDQQSIFKNACRIAVDSGKFRMAWVGIFSQNEQKVVPYTWAGYEEGYLTAVQISAGVNAYTSKGPTGKAFETKTFKYSNDIINDPAMQPWKDEANKRNYRSSISFPIVVNSEVIALYTLYSSEVNFFNSEEIKLLQEVTDNIAFALDKIRINELQLKARKELEESENKFRSLVEQSLVGVFILKDEKFIYANPGFEKMTGYSREYLLKKVTFDQLVHHDDLERVKNNYLLRVSGTIPTDQYVFKAIKSDGKIIYAEIIVSRIVYNNEPAVIGTVVDITDRMEEEKRVAKAVNDAQEKERIQIGMELHDNVKQILAASQLTLDVAKMKINQPHISIEAIDRSRGLIGDAIGELRRLSHQLAPIIDTSVSFSNIIRTLVNNMNSDHSYIVELNIDISDHLLTLREQTALYRILQEQLNNIKKYSKATRVAIKFKQKDQNLYMMIKDNGVGFDVKTKKQGIGLENIKRRAMLCGGAANIISSPGKGCKVVVEVPLISN